MRNLLPLERYRDHSPEVFKLYGTYGDANGGVFRVPAIAKLGVVEWLLVIASVGDGWDHVSVSAPHDCPTWRQMSMIKHMFFKDEEVCMQLHVAVKDHINCHPNCLHLWRPLLVPLPLPPKSHVA